MSLAWCSNVTIELASIGLGLDCCDPLRCSAMRDSPLAPLRAFPHSQQIVGDPGRQPMSPRSTNTRPRALNFSA